MGFEPSCAYLEKYRKDGVWRSVVCVSCLARAQLDNETSKSKSIRVRSTLSARSNSRPLTSENSMCRSQTRELSSNPSGFLALASTVEYGVDILQPSRGWGDYRESRMTSFEVSGRLCHSFLLEFSPESLQSVIRTHTRTSW